MWWTLPSSDLVLRSGLADPYNFMQNASIGLWGAIGPSLGDSNWKVLESARFTPTISYFRLLLNCGCL